MNWNTICVGNVCKYTTSGGTPRSSVTSYYEPPTVPWLKTKEVNYCRIYQTESYISQEGLDNSSAKLIPENSVIVAMYGQGDTAGRVAINKVPVSTNQACCNLIIDREKADYEFVYYALSTLYEKLVSLKNGGAQPNLNAQIIRSVEIPFPPLETQHKIAAFLSAYDALIENNQKQIKLLEEAAQRLYKEWFIDLRFPGHETTLIVDGVPEGWEIAAVTDLLEIKYGKDHKALANGDSPVYGSGGIMRKVNKILYSGESVLIPRKGSLNNILLVSGDFWTIDTMFYSVPKHPNVAKYVYLFLSGVDMYAMNIGAAVPSMTVKILDGMKMLFPTAEILERFEKVVGPYFSMIELLKKKNESLTDARDLLLPKLISGEIEV